MPILGALASTQNINIYLLFYHLCLSLVYALIYGFHLHSSYVFMQVSFLFMLYCHFILSFMVVRFHCFLYFCCFIHCFVEQLVVPFIVFSIILLLSSFKFFTFSLMVLFVACPLVISSMCEWFSQGYWFGETLGLVLFFMCQVSV